MKKGKLIVIEGTDCSGKGTQSEMLYQKLVSDDYKVYKTSFPMYDTPTGKIVGGPYLGKESITHGWFPEGANNVPAKVASLYYAADRLYNIDKINEHLNKGEFVILDRYTTSNMGHQAGKIKNRKERIEMFKWLEKLEYELLELPKPDVKIFLHMPYEYSKNLQSKRVELDQHEKSKENIVNAEKAYLELSEIYDFITIDCINNNAIRSIEEIFEELYKIVIEQIDMDN